MVPELPHKRDMLSQMAVLMRHLPKNKLRLIMVGFYTYTLGGGEGALNLEWLQGSL